jgi:hypothetical protein
MPRGSHAITAFVLGAVACSLTLTAPRALAKPAPKPASDAPEVDDDEAPS